MASNDNGKSSSRSDPFSAASRRARATMRQVRRTLPRIPIPRRIKPQPGATPGIEVHQLAKLPIAEQASARVTCIDYGPDGATTHDITDVGKLAAFLQRPREESTAVRWINVDGLTDMPVIELLARSYHFHPLAIEDILHVHQRPKVEMFNHVDDPATPRPRLFVVARMLQLIEGRLDSEQITMFLGTDTVLTFQQKHGDVWGAIRERINTKGSRLRTNDASFLLYALLDAVVDHCFPVLEHYSSELEDLDLIVLAGDANTVRELHHLKHELMLMRREIWPMRELISSLQRMEHVELSSITRLYLRDVYDHTVQLLDLVETYREIAMSLSDMWVNAVSNRMSQVMKVLTIIATIFIPLTFLAGVYGMNFEHMPELEWRWSYAVVWAIFLGTAGGMLSWFRRRGWI
ncbi:magnesium/cobalt transporter CorA [Phycisphaerales bacterium AB-hyl4]|uniref:Magnesium transport protein CorA n=1 Tax=Natronomicrosphaera hydrolytica TaxID=3242702 RepID=A0ABV4U1J5_9BACT